MAEAFQKLEQKRLAKKILSEGKEAKYWKKYRTIYETNDNANITFMTCRNTRKLFAYGAGNQVKIYDAAKQEVKITLSKFKSELVTSGSFRSDGKVLATGEQDGTVQLFDIKRKIILRSHKKHTKAVHAIAFAGYSNIVSGDDDMTLRVYDMATDEITRTFPQLHADYIRNVSAVPTNSNLLISGSYDGTLKLIDLRDPLQYVRLWKHEAAVEAHDIFPAGDRLVSVGGTLTRFWDMGSETPAFTLNNNLKTITCVNVLSNGEKVITGSVDEHLKIYSVKDYKVVHQIKCFESLMSMDFTPDETHLALGSSLGDVQVFYRKIAKETGYEDEKMNEFKMPDVLDEGKNFVKDYKFFNRGIYDEPENFDVEFEAGKKKRLQDYERNLKKFQYKEALDNAIKNGKKGIVLSMIEELVQREALDIALRNRTEEEYVPILTFIERNLGDPSQSHLLVDFASTCIDASAGTLLQTESGKRLFGSVLNKLTDLLEDQESMLSVLGQLEILQ